MDVPVHIRIDRTRGPEAEVTVSYRTIAGIMSTHPQTLLYAIKTFDRLHRGELDDVLRLVRRDLLAHDLAGRDFAELEGNECTRSKLRFGQ